MNDPSTQRHEGSRINHGAPSANGHSSASQQERISEDSSTAEVPKVKNVCVTPNVQESCPTLKVAWHPNATPGVTYTVKYSTQAGKVNEPPEGASKVEGIMGTSTTLTGLGQDKNYYIWVVAVSDDVEGPHSDRMTGTTLPELEDPDFMPFKFKDEAHFTRPARTGMRIRNEEGLRDLLYNHTYNKGTWLSKAKQLLGVPNEAPERVEIEHIALSLKDAVWEEYKVEERPEEEQGLFWVLDRTQPPTPRRGKKEPSYLNLFSFRALFGAVLHNGGKSKAEKENEQGLFPIHIAAQNLLPDGVLYLLSWGIDVNLTNDRAHRTALHYAVRFWQHDGMKRKRQRTLVQILKAFKASHDMEDTRGHVPLFNAILTQDIDLVKLLIDHANIDHADNEGDTHLHIAAEMSFDKIACLLIEKGADPTLRNGANQTPSHIAAQKSDSCLEAMSKTANSNGVEIIDTFSLDDSSGRSPLDYAAIHSHKKTFQYMWKCIQEQPRPDIASYMPVLDRLFDEEPKKIHFTTLQDTLKTFSKPDLQSHLTVDTAKTTNQTTPRTPSPNQGRFYQRASLYNLLQSKDDACTPVVTTVLDKCLYGEKVVVSKVLDSDADGEYPPKSNPDVVLRKFVSSHYRWWGHSTMKIWIDGKWYPFGNLVVCGIAVLHFLQMVALTTALCLAIRPGVTNETLYYYNTPLDQFRGFMEAVVILMWGVKIANEIYKLIVLQPNIYFRDLFVYINILAIVLVAITIVLRGFQSSIQWPFAALAYLTYSMLALEYLSLWKWSSTYIQTLFTIVKQDMTKFFAVSLVYLVGFAGAFLLVLQVDRAGNENVQEAGGMAIASSGDGAENSTIYIWNTFYLGLRLVVEAGSVLKYNGSLWWLAVLLYLSFLMVTAIIMLNVLIAQMSDTYKKVRGNARALATFHRARFLLRYLRHFGYWQTKRARNGGYNCIIWSDKGMSPTECDEDQDSNEVFREAKNFAKYMFLEDVIAKEDSTKPKPMMQEVMEELKAMKSDLKKLRQDITKDIQAEIAKMQEAATTGSSG